MKTLYMMVGLPRSGKTTRAREMNIPMVNPDAIRLALHGQRFLDAAEPMVWTLARYMVAALFEAGHEEVVLDATNLTRAKRVEWIDKRWKRRFVCVDTAAQNCIQRATELNDPYIIPVIEMMASQFEPPDKGELQSWETDDGSPVLKGIGL